MIVQDEKVPMWYINTWFPIKKSRVWPERNYLLMKIIWSNRSLITAYVSKLLQPMVNYYSNKSKLLSFFHSSYRFFSPIQLIETKLLTIFENVLSRVSNVMSILNWTTISILTKVLTFSKSVCFLQTQILFLITMFNWLNCSQGPPF